MLKRIRVENFKAWRKLDIKFSTVTGLFGNHSSGKSSILQFLLTLKQTKDAADQCIVLDFGGPTALVDLGTYLNVVHKHNQNATMRWTLDWTNPEAATESRRPRRETGSGPDCMQMECRVEWKDSELRAHYLRYNLGQSGLSLEAIPGDATGFDLTSNGSRFRSLLNKGRSMALPGPIKTHLFPFEAKACLRHTDILDGIEREYEGLMNRIFHLGPLRGCPRREYCYTDSYPSDVGLYGERSIEAILAATTKGEERILDLPSEVKSFQEVISHWLEELGLVSEFEIHKLAKGPNLYGTRVKGHHESSETMLADIGTGVSQILPALVLLYYVPRNSIVLLEQPEANLHPSVQSGIADLILTVAKSRQLQVIVESHSEHLLRRLQRRVAEQKVDLSDIRLYSASMSNRGTARLEDLRLNTWGEIMNLPQHFFGNDLVEVSATRVAGLKRRARVDE